MITNGNNEENVLDFSNNTETEQLTPGYRSVRFYNKEEKPFHVGTTKNGTSLLKLYVGNKGGSFYYESIHLTPKALPKLKSLYFALFKQPLTQSFKTIEELCEHLNDKFLEKYNENSYFNLKLQGEYSNQGVVFCQLPFNVTFITDSNFKERDFTTNEMDFYIKKANI